MLVQIITENGQKKIKPLTADAGAGNPVGTIIPMYKKSSPSGYLYCDGSTFDETKYPLLYAYLGSNVLPDYREAAIVGAEQNTTDTIATHDVYTEGQFKDDQLQDHKHSITDPGHTHTWSIGGQNPGGGQFIGYTNSSYTATPRNTGSKTTGITVNNPNSGRHGTVTRGKRKAVYFYIKATSGLSENAQDNIVAQLNEERSYSTSEVNTGKKWIDGKPIYRRSFTVSGIGTETWTNVTNASWINSVARIIDCEVSTNAVSDYGGHPKARITNGYLQSWDLAGYNTGVMTLEYTKTTD